MKLEMDRLLLPLLCCVMDASWIAAALVVLFRWAGRGQDASVLPLTVALLVALAGWWVGATVLRIGSAAMPVASVGLFTPDGQPDVADQVRRWLALLLGGCCSFAGAVMAHGVIAARAAMPGSAAQSGQEGVAGWASSAAVAVGRAITDDGLLPLLVIWMVLLFLWWRSQRNGTETPEYADVVRAFGIGSLALAAALLIGAGARVEAQSLALATPLFLITGVPALSLARLAGVREEAQSRHVYADADVIAASWYRAAAPPITVVLVLAALVALALASDDVRASLVGLFELAAALLWSALYWPLLALGYLAEWLIYFIRGLTAGRPDRPLFPPLPDMQQLFEETGTDTAGAAALPGLLRVLLVVGVAAGIVAAFLLTSKTVAGRRSLARRPPEDRESLLTWRDAWRALRQWLRRSLQAWLRGRPAPVGPAVSGRRAGAAMEAGDLDARAAYRQMLLLGQNEAVPRLPHQTPGEYLRRWRESLAGEADAAALTGAYVAARYGPPDGAKPEAGSLRRLLDRLTFALRDAATAAKSREVVAGSGSRVGAGTPDAEPGQRTAAAQKWRVRL